jgi:hypothetical protein
VGLPGLLARYSLGSVAVVLYPIDLAIVCGPALCPLLFGAVIALSSLFFLFGQVVAILGFCILPFGFPVDQSSLLSILG